MANSYSTRDLIKGTLQKCGENTDGSSQFHSLALKYINNVYDSLLSGSNEFSPETTNPWKWARTSATLTILPLYNTGTITLTINSLNGTFSSAPSISLAGYFLKLTGVASIYQINTHTASSTSFTLKSAFLEASGSYAYTGMPLIYSLGSNIERLVEPLRIYENRNLELGEDINDEGSIYSCDLDNFRKNFPLKLIKQGVPTRFTTISQSESAWNIQFNKYNDAPVKVDYEYIATQDGLLDSDSSIPLIPKAYRKVLEYGASFFLCLDKKDKENASSYFNLAKQGIEAMKMADDRNAKDTSNDYGRLIPRLDDVSKFFQE